MQEDVYKRQRNCFGHGGDGGKLENCKFLGAKAVPQSDSART